jgi:hypothetical protein
MTTADLLAPAPGRTIVPLVRGWTAVVLQPLAGVPLVFVDLFRDGADAPELELSAGETRRFLRALRRGRKLHRRSEAEAMCAGRGR